MSSQDSNNFREKFNQTEDEGNKPHFSENGMLRAEHRVNYWPQIEAVIAVDRVNRRQQEILNASPNWDGASRYRALFTAYDELTDQQKIEFILGGGAAQLFQCQQQEWWQNQRGGTDGYSSDTGTGDLPVMC